LAGGLLNSTGSFGWETAKLLVNLLM
jgi:hypothetical protein